MLVVMAAMMTMLVAMVVVDDDGDNDDNACGAESISSVQIMKKNISLENHGDTFLLGIYGHYFSKTFHDELINDIQNDLLFCKSPTGHQMLRVSLSIKESLFLLGSKVSQCILFACNILAPSSLLLLLLPLFLLLDN